MSTRREINKMLESVAYAKHHSQADHRWSTVYWVFHNTCTGVALVSQLIVVFGLALISYIPSQQGNFLNVWLLFVSGLGCALNLLDILLGLNRRSKLLGHAAGQLQLALALFSDKQISSQEFAARLDEAVRLRNEQHSE